MAAKDAPAEDGDAGNDYISTVIKECDMSEQMKAFVQEICIAAHEKFKDNQMKAAKMIKDALDQKYGARWHVVLGAAFGFKVSYLVGSMFYMFFNDYRAVLVWKYF